MHQQTWICPFLSDLEQEQGRRTRPLWELKNRPGRRAAPKTHLGRRAGGKQLALDLSLSTAGRSARVRLLSALLPPTLPILPWP